MFNDETLEKIFANKEMQSIPVGYMHATIDAFEKILQEILEVNPYAAISELFLSTAPGD